MTSRFVAARAPALSLQEAALLPAISGDAPPVPCNLMMPPPKLDFRPVDIGAKPVDKLPRRGSMAGRAVLRMVGR